MEKLSIGLGSFGWSVQLQKQTQSVELAEVNKQERRANSDEGEDLSAYALKRCSVLHGALSKGSFTALANATFEVALEEVISFFAWGEKLGIQLWQWH